MDMDIDDTFNPKPEPKGEEKGNAIVVILIGAPGSGKSTFCNNVISSSSRPWVRVCQDTINNGKAGTKPQCLKSAISSLKEGKSVFIDRCNLDKDQRAEFVKLGTHSVEVHAVMLDLPAKVCISRSVKRSEHEGNLQGGKAAAVVNRMLQKKELPKLNEGFARITYCQNESEVQSALHIYSALSPVDNLPEGYSGQKKPDAKIQVGIMKFLKKVETLPSDANSNQDTLSHQTTEKTNSCLVKEDVSSVSGVKLNESIPDGSVHQNSSSNEVLTLAFPSISTADFKFDLEKASDIIVEKVEEFLDKLDDARLVLVDLTHGSKILSLVKTKTAKRNIDSKRFFTFVGDITKLYSEGGLRCNVIANAANWRLKSGGGGVNAAIFNAAGPALEVATMEQGSTLHPGNAMVVPLPSTSPLYTREGVTHVIHVLGPNMNRQRPNFLNNDYIKGCQILREAYTSLFEGFVSIVKNQPKLYNRSKENACPETSVLQESHKGGSEHHISDQKKKESSPLESERSKKCKGSHFEIKADKTDSKAGKDTESKGKTNGKTWGSWAQSLYHIAMHPENSKDALLEVSDDVIVLNDLYPKARKHLLVISRHEGLDRLADVSKDHLHLLMAMHDVGLKWTDKFLLEDNSLVFRLGYHSVPSMRQLHLHVVSQDFDSKNLKNKKHWNSFNTVFFRDSVDVMEEINRQGFATLKEEDKLLSMELRCNRCRSAHPNIPRLKTHIGHCVAPFPTTLSENNRLVLAGATHVNN